MDQCACLIEGAILCRFTKEVFTYADYQQARNEFVAKKEAEAAKGRERMRLSAERVAGVAAKKQKL